MADTPTIFEWAGGREPMVRWLETFYDAVERDDLLGSVFGGTVSREHRDHVADWWCEVMADRPSTPPTTADTRTCCPSTGDWRSAARSG